MTRTFLHSKVAVFALVLVAGAGTTWALWQGQPTDAPAGPANLRAAEVLAALPSPKAPTAVDQAIQRWSDRVKRRAQDDDAWAQLGDALMQKARETADSSWYLHAERAYGKALALNARNVTATTGQAWVEGCRHEFEKSTDWAHKALALDPNNHAAHGLLGDAAVEMGDYDSAFEHYQKMLDLRPDLSSYSRGAHVLFLTGDLRKAAWLMGKAIGCGAPYAENTAWCRAQLALMHFSNGNLVAAEKTLQDAQQLTPSNYHVLAALGKLKAAAKDYAGAIDCYRKAADIAPQYEVLVALADLYRLTDQRAEADKQDALVETIHRLHKANGVRGDSQLALFWADRDRNLPEALQLAEDEYKTRKNVFVADALAWCLHKNGRHEDAKRIIARALAKRTPDASILYHAGMIHAKLGDRVQAQKYLAQALSLNPNFSPVHAPLAADALQALGASSASATAETDLPVHDPAKPER